MQITSTKIKHLRFALASLMVWCFVSVAQARDGSIAPSETANSPAAYRELYKDAVIPVKYILVDKKGHECCRAPGPQEVYVLDFTRDAPTRKIFASEITKLAAAHFEVEVDHETLIETPKADFVVLKLSRPIEYSKKAKPCAAGMGENRYYLARIDDNAIRLIDRNLLGCGDTLSVSKDKDTPGYEITVNHAGEGKGQSVRYVYHDGHMSKRTSTVRSTNPK